MQGQFAASSVCGSQLARLQSTTNWKSRLKISTAGSIFMCGQHLCPNNFLYFPHAGYESAMGGRSSQLSSNEDILHDGGMAGSETQWWVVRFQWCKVRKLPKLLLTRVKTKP